MLCGRQRAATRGNATCAAALRAYDRPMRFIAFALPLLLLACAKEPKQSPPSPPPAPTAAVPAPAPPVALADDWQDAPRTAGDWVYRSDARGSLALFGPSGGDARFLIRCDNGERRIYLSRMGRFSDSDSGAMTIRASSGTKSFPARNNGGTPAYVAVDLPVNEPQLDAIAFSRGRFLVSVKGGDDLVIPSWPEIARVIEDCRR